MVTVTLEFCCASIPFILLFVMLESVISAIACTNRMPLLVFPSTVELESESFDWTSLIPSILLARIFEEATCTELFSIRIPCLTCASIVVPSIFASEEAVCTPFSSLACTVHPLISM